MRKDPNMTSYGHSHYACNFSDVIRLQKLVTVVLYNYILNYVIYITATSAWNIRLLKLGL